MRGPAQPAGSIGKIIKMVDTSPATSREPNKTLRGVVTTTSPTRSSFLKGASLVGLSFMLAGCMSFMDRRGPGPLPATPTTPVASSTLNPPVQMSDLSSESLAEAAGEDGTPIDGTVDTALAPPLADGESAEVSEDDLIGVWSASTPSATCSINLSLTTWTGGYRASTRNCGDVQLAALSAWSVEGRQVLLKGEDGAPLARLFRTGGTRYAGQLESGQGLTVFR